MVRKAMVRLGPDGHFYIALPKRIVKRWKVLPGDKLTWRLEGKTLYIKWKKR
jgi:hypothetical protein